MGGHIHIAPMFQRYLRHLYDRTLTGRQQWNQAEYMHRVGGGVGSVKKGSGVWLFSGPPSLRASNSWNQTSMCINTLRCAWMHASMHAPTSHLHGTQWCWECDVRLDSSVRRVVLLSPHQSYSASLVVQETTPEEKDREWQKDSSQPSLMTSLPKLDFQQKKYLSIRDHERLALDTPSKVSYMPCDAHETDITLVCRSCFNHCSDFKNLIITGLVCQLACNLKKNYGEKF